MRGGVRNSGIQCLRVYIAGQKTLQHPSTSAPPLLGIEQGRWLPEPRTAQPQTIGAAGYRTHGEGDQAWHGMPCLDGLGNPSIDHLGHWRMADQASQG